MSRCYKEERSPALVDDVHGPRAGHAFQLVGPARREPDRRSGDEWGYRLRHEDLVCAGKCGDTGADVDGETTDSVPHQLDLTGVQPGADAQAERRSGVPDPAGAVDRAGRPVERGERPVTCRFDDLAAEARDVRPKQVVVCLAEPSPRRIADTRGTLG